MRNSTIEFLQGKLQKQQLVVRVNYECSNDDGPFPFFLADWVLFSAAASFDDVSCAEASSVPESDNCLTWFCTTEFFSADAVSLPVADDGKTEGSDSDPVDCSGKTHVRTPQIDRVKVYIYPFQHKIGQFGDVLPSQSLGLVLKN